MDNTTIKVHCRTNIDNYKREVWPKQFCCRPVVGDRVQSESGSSLKIHTITHSQSQISHDLAYLHTGKYEPILIIELHN